MAENNGKQIEDVRKLAIYKMCKCRPYLGWKDLLERSKEMLTSFPDSPKTTAVDNLKHDLRKLVEQGVIGKSKGKTKRKSAYFVTENAMIPEYLKGWDSAFEEYLREKEYPRIVGKEHPSSALLTVQKDHAEKVKKGIEPLKNLLGQWKSKRSGTFTEIKTNLSYSSLVTAEIKAMEEKWFFKDLMENHSSRFKKAVEEFKEGVEEYKELSAKLSRETDNILDIKKISKRVGLESSNWERTQITGAGDGWRWCMPRLEEWIEQVIKYCEHEGCCDLEYLFHDRIRILPNDASYTLYVDGKQRSEILEADKYFNGKPKHVEELGKFGEVEEVRVVPNDDSVYTFFLDEFPILKISKREVGNIPLVAKEHMSEGELLADTLGEEVKEYNGYHNLSVANFRPAKLEGFVEEFCKSITELLNHKVFAGYTKEFLRLNMQMEESGMEILTVLEDLEGYEILPRICKYISPE